MAFLDILNIPSLMGRDLHSFKRANIYDKLDLALAGTVGLIGALVLILNGFSSPLLCVPASCNSDSGNSHPNCALDWTYQNALCKNDVLSLPDASFHYLLLVLSLLLIGLLTVPIYWGSNKSKELFDNFYYIWAKLKNGDEECKDVEWKRRMNFVLDQLKSSKSLTTRYALYHGLALILDLLALTAVVLYTLNFTVFGLDAALPPLDIIEGQNATSWSGLFNSQPPLSAEPTLALSSKAKCAGGSFVCDIPNRDIFKWFGVLTSLLLLVKTIINLKCLLFSLGLPGLFGRNFLIYADQLNDNFGEPIYNIQINPIIVLLQTIGVVLRLIFIAPLQWLIAFCRFYSQRHYSPKEIIKRLSATNIRAELKETKKLEKQAKALETEVASEDAKNKDAKKEKPKEEKKEKPKEEKKEKPKEEPKEKDAPKEKEKEKPKEQSKEDDKKDEPKPTPLVTKPAQNWSDLFFIIDALSYNIDMCDLILFMTKMNPVPGIENKKVNVDVSYLDTTTNTLVFSHTDAGVMESLLDTELSTSGGLQIVGWLEGPTGNVSSQKPQDNPKNLAFSVSLGSTYEFVSAVYARGRMLARLQNFTFQCPQDTKKQMKKYGANVPLAAFISQSLFQKFSSDQGVGA
eukprot:GFUD01011268.1.p1 GENE.GFUD01011268.1~~GFUD01011268.1.p1  ORF type:complete len:629 (-),score=141.53 GFUD01011268.1:250-2136(-)